MESWYLCIMPPPKLRLATPGIYASLCVLCVKLFHAKAVKMSEKVEGNPRRAPMDSLAEFSSDG
jgi:hypothetical protein